jgi:hypothetical protein
MLCQLILEQEPQGKFGHDAQALHSVSLQYPTNGQKRSQRICVTHKYSVTWRNSNTDKYLYIFNHVWYFMLETGTHYVPGLIFHGCEMTFNIRQRISFNS